jgi:response regulator RpfG family c-di-GMP phosphodiesterase
MKELQTEHQAMLDLLFNFISVNPHLSGQFAQNVARTCRLLAAHVVPDPKDQQQIVMAGLLSQLGLLGMDPMLYSKPFHLLDGTERQQFCTHPALAQLMLLPATHLAVMSDAIYHQYERYNGSGTPDRMVGTDIPVGARIIALARDFWLLVEQQGSARDEVLMNCLQQLKMHQGSYYDPVLVNIMLALQLHQLTAVESVTSAHQQISTAELQPGLVLERPLYNESRILLLPHGHVFSSASIAKLKQIEAKRDKKWLLLVSAQTKTTE